MKPSVVISALAAVSLATSAPAASPSTSAPSPILGTWDLDLASMPVPPEARPTRVTVQFSDGGADGWTVTYVIAGRDGGERRMTSRARPDGTAVPIEGDRLEADSVAMARPAPNVLVMGLSRDGRPGSVRVYTISADGNAMTENAANVGDDGKPVIRTFRWLRQTARR